MTLSVQFYKRLILLVLLLMILIPTGTAIRLGAKSARLEKQLASRRRAGAGRSSRRE